LMHSKVSAQRCAEHMSFGRIAPCEQSPSRRVVNSLAEFGVHRGNYGAKPSKVLLTGAKLRSGCRHLLANLTSASAMLPRLLQHPVPNIMSIQSLTSEFLILLGLMVATGAFAGFMAGLLGVGGGIV